MKNANVTNSNPFLHEVEVNVNKFRALMLDWDGRQVDCTNIVPIY